MEDGGDIPELSGSTLAALQEFYSERESQQTRFENLKAAIDGKEKLSMNSFSEDWNVSQFWYSDETATTLAEQLLEGATNDTAIAVVSAPSAFIQLKNTLMSEECSITPQICLLEFDERFRVLEEFVHYNYQKPLQLPAELKGRFDRILCDPPFLSEDCQTKAAMTVRWLSKTASKEEATPVDPRIIICTGERMEGLILKVYPGTRTTIFEPEHAQRRLGNEFRCYANYESSAWKWR